MKSLCVCVMLILFEEIMQWYEFLHTGRFWHGACSWLIKSVLFGCLGGKPALKPLATAFSWKNYSCTCVLYVHRTSHILSDCYVILKSQGLLNYM